MRLTLYRVSHPFPYLPGSVGSSLCVTSTPWPQVFYQSHRRLLRDSWGPSELLAPCEDIFQQLCSPSRLIHRLSLKVASQISSEGVWNFQHGVMMCEVGRTHNWYVRDLQIDGEPAHWFSTTYIPQGSSIEISSFADFKGAVQPRRELGWTEE